MDIKKQLGQHFAPESLSKLSFKLFNKKIQENDIKNIKNITIYDPSCGNADTLIYLYHNFKKLYSNKNIKIIGQEIDEKTYNIALENIKKNNIKDYKIYNTDTLKNNEIYNEFDNNSLILIFSNPPYIKTNINNKKIDIQFLFMNHIINIMNEYDNVLSFIITFFSFPYKMIKNNIERQIRQKIYKSKYIEYLIFDIDNLFKYTDSAISLWFLNNNYNKDSIRILRIFRNSSLYSKLTSKKRYHSDNDIKNIINILSNNKVNNLYVKDFNINEMPIHPAFDLINIEPKRYNNNIIIKIKQYKQKIKKYIEYKKLDELFIFKKGYKEYNSKYIKNPNNKGNIPLYTAKQKIKTYIKPLKNEHIIDFESISFNTRNIVKPFYHNNEKFIYNDLHYLIIPKNNINIKYLYYLFKNIFDKCKFEHATNGPLILINKLKKMEISYINDINIQKNIVNFIENNKIDKEEYLYHLLLN